MNRSRSPCQSRPEAMESIAYPCNVAHHPAGMRAEVKPFRQGLRTLRGNRVCQDPHPRVPPFLSRRKPRRNQGVGLAAHLGEHRAKHPKALSRRKGFPRRDLIEDALQLVADPVSRNPIYVAQRLR